MTASGNPSNLSRYWPLIIFALLMALAVVLPKGAFAPFDLVGYAVCHRITQRSFIINQTQLPVCARDTGMFNGVLLGVLYFSAILRERAAGFPSKKLMLLLGLSVLIWGIDGFNSYLVLLRGEPLLYEPRNWLRLTTGAFMGVSLSAFVVTLFNQAVWREQSAEAVVSSFGDVLKLWLIAIALILIVLSQAPFLYGPLALSSGLGVLMLLTMVNGLIVLIARSRHNKIEHWRELVPYFVLGLALCVAEIALIDAARSALTTRFDLPF